MTRLGTILTKTLSPKKPYGGGRVSLTPAGEAALDALLDTEAAVQSVRQAYDGKPEGQPKPEWVRGVCPTCGGPVVSNMYYVGGKGYRAVWECWHSLSETPSCSYRKVL